MGRTGSSRHNTSQTRHTALPDINAQIHAPFDLLEEEEVRRQVDNFMTETSPGLYRRFFEMGAFIAQNDRAFEGPRDDDLSLTDDEKESLDRETTSQWRQPRALWYLVILCAIGASTQGWDESAVDGGEA